MARRSARRSTQRLQLVVCALAEEHVASAGFPLVGNIWQVAVIDRFQIAVKNELKSKRLLVNW